MDEIKLISSESLKRVIIRYDFSGCSSASIQPWIETVKHEYLDFFNDYAETACGSMTIDMSHPELVSVESGLGVKELTRGVLHIFQNGSINDLSDKLKLEISHFSMTLTVNCIGYVSSEPYRNLMDTLMHSLLKHDKFIRIKRFGIRKIDLFSFNSDDELKKNLSPVAFNCEILDAGMPFLDRKFIDNYLFDYTENVAQTRVIYQRGLRKELKNSAEFWSAIIDLDCFKEDNENQRPDLDALKRNSAEMNTLLYNFFCKSLTEEYIKGHERN